MMEFFQENHDMIIYVIVGVILCFQVYLFIKNFIKIGLYKKAINGVDQLEIVDVVIPEEAITKITPNHILEKRELFKKTKDEEVDQVEEVSEKFEENKNHEETEESQVISLSSNHDEDHDVIEEENDLPF